MKKIVSVLFTILIFTGCSVWKTIPESAKANNPYYDVSLSTEDFTTIDVKITNNTDNDIEILWNKTFYIDSSGGTNGGFSYGKETHWEEKDSIISPVIIFPHTTVIKALWPLANRKWHRGWHWTHLHLGSNGILLTMLVNGKEIKEKLTFEVVIKKTNPFTKQ